MRRVLVTGGTGFIAAHLVPLLRRHGWQVSVATRNPEPGLFDETVSQHAVGDLGPETDWRDALAGMDAVVHLAARVHVMRERSADPGREFRRANVEGTRRLAEQAAEAGVRRLVFVSSIKVNGEATAPGADFTEDTPPAPVDPYGISKLEAERVLAAVADKTGLEVTILRPPLVYGAGVKGNFRTLIRTCRKGLPLPLGRAGNRRSLLYVGNLADAVRICLANPRAAGRTFLLSDGEAVSVAELIRRLCRALGVRPRLVGLPPALLRLTGRLTGKSETVARLLDSLVVDGGQIRRTLDWTPPFTLDQGLAETAGARDPAKGES